VARDRAREIYRSITERRRDPALITWSGPDWIEAGRRRYRYRQLPVYLRDSDVKRLTELTARR
jgi:hypothetical protein